ASYDPTERVVSLGSALPQDLVDHPSKQVFVRVWESQFDFPSDDKTSVELKDASGTGTGVYVFVGGSARTPGDYWTIGVRPGTPRDILPARLKETFQRPDGPKR